MSGGNDLRNTGNITFDGVTRYAGDTTNFCMNTNSSTSNLNTNNPKLVDLSGDFTIGMWFKLDAG